jgi:uncharacterized protein YsxB (DUF464 family)
MVKVVLTYKGGALKSLRASGHAGAGEYGHDLVCAAVSAIIVGGFNALKDESAIAEAKADEGDAYLELRKAPDEHDRIVIETMVTQIESVALSYPKNVSLERRTLK